LTCRFTAAPFSPWGHTDGWRLNDEGRQELRFDDGIKVVPVMVHYRASGYELDLPGGRVAATGRLGADGTLEATLGERTCRAVVARLDGEIVVCQGARSRALRFVDPRAASVGADAGGGRLTAPMPGKIFQINVRKGVAVAAGQALLVIEAMKMEHTIAAPADGTITAVHYAVGDQVEEGADLLDFEPAEKA
jgi:3-methylcrotonyl-CoA carboxylase alpha subunit